MNALKGWQFAMGHGHHIDVQANHCFGLIKRPAITAHRSYAT